MATLYTHKDANIRRTWFLISFFLIFIIGLGWVFSYQFNSPAILVAAVIFSSLMSFTSYWYSDKIVLAISKAREIKKEDQPELYRLIENLSITAGLPLPKIYLIDEAAPNAFATGRNAEHAVVAVTRGLLDKLNRPELEGVIAHELSHIGNQDILLQTVVVILVGLVALLSDWFLRWSFFGRGRRSDRSEGGQIAAVMAVAGIVLAILSPLIATLIQLAISRKREFLADADGALLTRYPEGLASALEKISRDQTPLRAANKATAHLYIANPFRGKNISKLFMTHPPIAERVRNLREMRV
ncbi:MAG: zinc metalloprotease HtpX [Candidatus Portnoybacteria bacterium CG10_big_fil_rev_8_21_14_0_10_43_39]|uniref:Protease HtpX homolog n=2 Tax=Candidatus Portnoyibacteriota TaxID=1817913 RepID=A0A2M7YLV4_9BACT|nr:MAG: zinc metalloprotease HtpX [Candidatus Portnoybacteria bacterium CG23_combo_of_CG06-09_8_20_14_all_44_36]PJA63975.1 MAG: zinc metalloprotease HtpX [Candidatus Portnoybacteria bacterium CG_4_9_14_3_um_filter_43_11]PJE59170.1 MAG: zinc metalloprotease HtpX [Candidatus Portnoybacteria bacterium CG10_big_fil_rev_8_21_14_0_10_43_39]